MKKKIAVVLSGSGVYDGSEIHEATLTLLAIARQGADYECFAPDVEQAHVINHLTGEAMDESRNVLVESARIARGKIKALSAFDAAEFDALIFPGGFGVAKNLCTFAFDGVACKVNSEVRRTIETTHAMAKPIGALCISPVLITKVITGAEVTIGSDAETAGAIVQMAGKHVDTTHGEVVVDAHRKIVTTPCYMLNASIDQIADGAENLVRTVLALV